MDDIDDVLKRAANAAVPARVASVDARVFSRISGYSFAAGEFPIGLRIAALAVALFMGVAGGMMPSEPAALEQSLSPISGAAQFAPSTLLMSAS